MIESAIAHLEDEVRKVEIERVQSATKHRAKIMFVYDSERQEEMEVAMVPKYRDPEGKDALEEVVHKFFTKASLGDKDVCCWK